MSDENDEFEWDKLEKKRRRCYVCGKRRMTVILFPDSEYLEPLCKQCFYEGDFDK